jgi:hypothetical protein
MTNHITIDLALLADVCGGAPKPGDPGFIGPVSPRSTNTRPCPTVAPPQMWNGDNHRITPGPVPTFNDKMNAGIIGVISGPLNPFGWMRGRR